MKRGKYAKLNNRSKTFFYANSIECKFNDDGDIETHYHGGREPGATGQTMVIVEKIYRLER